MLTKAEIDAMSADESIELAVLLWEHAHDAAATKVLTDKQRQELDRRLEYSLSHPGLARPWKDVMEELESKYEKI
jgi:putative addiction module component (TIGR02574 family)